MEQPDLEMQMVLAMVTRSIHAIEMAQRELTIQHRDLTRQADWIKDEIRKSMSLAPSGGTIENRSHAHRRKAHE